MPHKYFEPIRYIFFAISILCITACGTNKELRKGGLYEDQTYLGKTNIEIQSENKIRNRKTLEYELSTVAKPKANDKFLGLFRVRLWGHHKTLPERIKRDTLNWVQRTVKKVISEPPALYSDQVAEQNAVNMQRYLQNQGYFNATVKYESDPKKNKTHVLYTCYPGPAYEVDTVFFESKDDHIQALLNDTEQESNFKMGSMVSGKNYDLEKNRITQELRENGFAFFYPNYIPEISVDSTDGKVNVYVDVLPINDSTLHQTYTIGDINIYPEFSPALTNFPKSDTLINDLHFITDGPLRVSAQTITNSIFLKRGELYNQADFEKTVRRLNSLGVFKFVSIKPEKDSDSTNVVNFNIKLTPSKKWVFGADFEVNNSNYSNQSDRATLLGFALKTNLRNRNTFGGAEILLTQLEGGVQFNISDLKDNPIYSTDLRAQADLYLPKFADYLGIWKALRKFHIVKKNFYLDMVDRANTRFGMGYSYQWLTRFYERNVFNASVGYEIQRSITSRYSVTHLGVDYLLPRTFPEFQVLYLDDNPLLEKSFEKTLITGFLFRNFSYIFSSLPNERGESYYFSGDIEVSGAEMFGINWLVNKNIEPLKVFNTEFAQYALFDGQFRFTDPINPKTSMAYRVTSGLAIPFIKENSIPYVKQFYLGGPSSIRGWRIRELGPGSFDENISQDSLFTFYQAADIKLEFNAELRFDMFWRLKGAVFLDGGNIWTLTEDDNRPGSKFNRNFLNQIALGTGFGIRADFTYFILRLDLGLKMRSPYRDDDFDTHWLFEPLWSKLQLKDLNYNLAIGYPF